MKDSDKNNWDKMKRYNSKTSINIHVVWVVVVLWMIAYALSARNNRILKEQNKALRKNEHIKDSLYRNCNSKIIEHNNSVNMYESYLGSDANKN